MNVSIHIDRLVIHGTELTAADAARLEEALCAELGRLAQDSAPWAANGRPAAPAVVRAPSEAAASSSPQDLGVAVARSLHAGLRAPAAARPGRSR